VRRVGCLWRSVHCAFAARSPNMPECLAHPALSTAAVVLQTRVAQHRGRRMGLRLKCAVLPSAIEPLRHRSSRVLNWGREGGSEGPEQAWSAGVWRWCGLVGCRRRPRWCGVDAVRAPLSQPGGQERGGPVAPGCRRPRPGTLRSRPSPGHGSASGAARRLFSSSRRSPPPVCGCAD
jgi:hypothetical protein